MSQCSNFDSARSINNVNNANAQKISAASVQPEIVINEVEDGQNKENNSVAEMKPTFRQLFNFLAFIDCSCITTMKNSWIIFLYWIIGEYSATKIHFFPWRRKNCEKVSLYFSLSGEKFQILGGKSIKIGIFWVKSFPHSYSFPPPRYFYLAEYSPMSEMLRVFIFWYCLADFQPFNV